MVVIHTSLKPIGMVENGADGLIDTFCEYLSEGILVVPTHTWNFVNADNPLYDGKSTPSRII